MAGKPRAPPPSEWGLRVGTAYTQTGVLAMGRAQGSTGKIEELGRPKTQRRHWRREQNRDEQNSGHRHLIEES